MFGCSIGTKARRGRLSSTGDTTSRSYNASPKPCAMALHSSNCPTASGNCAHACSSAPAVTGRWSISWPWCYSTMSNLLNRPLPGPWNRGPSKQHVLNCLSRLEEPVAPAPEAAPGFKTGQRTEGRYCTLRQTPKRTS